jgi:hypothetical protein
MMNAEVRAIDYQASFRCTREEWETYQRMAAEDGVSAAAWIRDAVRARAEGRSFRRAGVFVLAVELPERLREQLEASARENFRTVELEAAALLSKALDK